MGVVAAEVASGDQLFQRRRRTAFRVAELVVERLHDREERIETDQVSQGAPRPDESPPTPIELTDSMAAGADLSVIYQVPSYRSWDPTSHHRRVRGRDLGCQAVPGALGRTTGRRELAQDMGPPSPLGATPGPAGVSFRVYAWHATRFDLLLFDRVDGARPTHVIRIGPAANRTYHCWHAFVADVTAGQLYGYRVEGPWDPDKGLRFDPAKVLLDPYGRGVAVPAGHSRDAATGPGDNCATAMKSLAVDPSACDWERDRPLRRPSTQTIFMRFTCGERGVPMRSGSHRHR